MPDEYKDIGNKLGQKRKELGKEIDEISEIIKVSSEYLKAIEKGDFKALPSIVYYKLFVRSYAQELGLDGNQLLEQFEIEDESVEGDDGSVSEKKTAVKKRRRPESETPLLKIGIILAIIVIIAFIIIIMLVPHNDKIGRTGNVEENIDTIESNPDSQSLLMQNVAPPEDSTPQPVELPMRLSIFIKDSCWIMVAADGDTVLKNTLQSGARRSYTADYRFLISMGNPYNVDLKINDMLLRDISNQGRVVKGFEINRLNKADLFYIPEDSLAE